MPNLVNLMVHHRYRAMNHRGKSKVTAKLENGFVDPRFRHRTLFEEAVSNWREAELFQDRQRSKLVGGEHDCRAYAERQLKFLSRQGQRPPDGAMPLSLWAR